ncbi:MAG: DUF1343 domain-containing protein [Lachnospiraceae bacterium]|nr:DUF1343 domain-containing protein [Lachnospiraceae bacterium]
MNDIEKTKKEKRAKRTTLTLLGILCLIVLMMIGCGQNGPAAKDMETGAETAEDGSEAIRDEATEEANENAKTGGDQNADEKGTDTSSTDINGAGENSTDENGLEIIATDSESESETDAKPVESKQPLTLGDERTDVYLPLLEGKRVAVFSNQTGIVGNVIEAGGEPLNLAERIPADGEVTYGPHILDVLIENGVNVTAAFSPEHGFRGSADAGASVSDSVDAKTGVPILSLYAGKSHYPSDNDMQKFDTLVIDMQDVGVRYYTYHISMYYLMDACAKAGKQIVLLDRPNPNGFYVDGPILQDSFKSGVGQLPLPVVYGMTWGELAQMINGEGWLSAGKNAADLTVVPCLGYRHQDKTDVIVRPSPNLKDMRAIYLYPSTCYFENTALSVGRGTEYPFEIFGSPYLEGAEGYDFSFTPKSMSGAKNPPMEGQECFGRDLRGMDTEQIWDKRIDLSYVIDAYQVIREHSPSVFFFGKADGEGIYWIDRLFGTDSVRHMIEEGKSAEEIKASWQPEIERFLEQRRPYLLYEE